VNSTTCLLPGLAGFIILTSCASPWERYDESLYSLLKNATPEAVEDHIELLGEIVTGAEEKGEKPPPGVCAEYGYRLATQKGELDKGLKQLDKETGYYPESELFVLALKRSVSGKEKVFEGTAAAEENVP